MQFHQGFSEIHIIPKYVSPSHIIEILLYCLHHWLHNAMCRKGDAHIHLIVYLDNKCPNGYLYFTHTKERVGGSQNTAVQQGISTKLITFR